MNVNYIIISAVALLAMFGLIFIVYCSVRTSSIKDYKRRHDYDYRCVEDDSPKGRKGCEAPDCDCTIPGRCGEGTE